MTTLNQVPLFGDCALYQRNTVINEIEIMDRQEVYKMCLCTIAGPTLCFCIGLLAVVVKMNLSVCSKTWDC